MERRFVSFGVCEVPDGVVLHDLDQVGQGVLEGVGQVGEVEGVVDLGFVLVLRLLEDDVVRSVGVVLELALREEGEVEEEEQEDILGIRRNQLHFI